MTDSSYYNIALHILGVHYAYTKNIEQISIACQSVGLNPTEMYENSKKECRNAFFNMGRDKNTNLMTPAAYDEFITSGLYDKITLDHPIGRTTSAIMAFDMVERGIFGFDNIHEFAIWIETQCEVYWVTTEENQKLKKFQTLEYSHLSVGERYYLVETENGRMLPKPDIECMIAKPDLRKYRAQQRLEKTVYIIHSIEYNHEYAMKMFNITLEQLEYRCNYKGDKWSEWHKKENQ